MKAKEVGVKENTSAIYVISCLVMQQVYVSMKGRLSEMCHIVSVASQ